MSERERDRRAERKEREQQAMSSIFLVNVVVYS